LVAITNTNLNPGFQSDWSTTDTPCSWVGVTCQDGYITALSLPRRGLRTLPSEIGNLSSLSYLDLGENQLTTLPPEIGSLSSLSELFLYENQLTTLPPEIGNLSYLSWLDLRENQLMTLPPERKVSARRWLQSSMPILNDTYQPTG